MAGYDFHIIRKILVECRKFRGLARRLTPHNRSDLGCFPNCQNTALGDGEVKMHTRAILGDNFVNGFRLYTVNNVIANSRNKMSVRQYIDILLHHI